jgi:2-amino-4-hydroxy-6-hydroxymethyldihydropteridine diphosphokinase
MNGIYLLLGTNLGNRLSNLRSAAERLIAQQIQIIEESSIYETASWGNTNQPAFLNVVVEVSTSHDPELLLEKILFVEQEMGRIREKKWGSRIIDIDILYYHDMIIETADLHVPHPGIPDRKFTLVPLVELNPFGLHPVSQKNQMELLASCTDTLDCRLTDFKL